MNNFCIKPATARDVPQLWRMIQDFAAFENLSEFCQVTEERLRDAMFGENPCAEGLVAVDGYEVAIGYAIFYQNFASFRGQRGVYLEDLYVAPEARNAGVGLALIKHLAKIARARGSERMDWQVLTWNTAAIKFYQKLGAEPDESERHWKITGADFEKLAD